jgi:ribosomal protein S18 acetylase RimI-like enzyme
MNVAPEIRIAPVRTADDLVAAAVLFRRYAESLDVDLAYQNFETEVATLPGFYAPPVGTLLLARRADDTALGCVGLRPLAIAGCCEMKRLYVSPEGRSLGLGNALAEAIVREGARIGYREMRLDTLPSMTEAIALYRKLGFEPTAAYYETPVAGTVFMRRGLQCARLSPRCGSGK